MSSYAVVWRAANGRAACGTLELDAEGLWLSGGNRDAEVRVEVPYDEIVAAERDPVAHIGPARAIRLESRAAGPLLLASVTGVSVLGEILETLQQALT